MCDTLQILLIEDNPGDARLFRLVLAENKTHRFVLAQADDLAAGRAQLAAGTFDAVLLDLNLPDSRGLATLLQVQGWAPQLPVVVLTGLDDEQLAAQAMRAGGQDYLVKGDFDSRLLARTILHAIERKKIEAALREERDRAQLYLDVAGTLIVVIGVDECVQLINKRGCEVLGGVETEITGKNWFDRFIPESVRDTVRNVFRRLMAGEIQLVEYFENSVLTTGGEERIIAWHNTVLRDDAGRIVGALNSGEDVTERRQTEKQLQAWADIFRHAEWGIAVTESANNAFGMMNPAFARMHGYPMEELIGRPSADTIAPENRDQLPGIIRKIHEDGFLVFENRHIRKDGTTFPALVSATAIKNARGEVTRRIINVQDITELKRLEAEAINAQLLRAELEKERELVALRDRMVSTVSHEFRTPLSVIRISTDMLALYFDRLEPNRRLEILHQIQDQIARVDRMIENTLTLSRLQFGKVSFQPTPQLLADFYQDIVEQARLIDNNEHHFVLTCAAPNVPVLIDSTLLRHVFINVLSNAIKYSPSGQTVAFELSCAADTIIFRVTDTGIGIPPTDLEHIFEPFHRSENVGKKPGTGLGLAIAQQYIQLHGGDMVIQSQENQGTMVTVRLPLHYPAAVAAAPEYR